MKGYINTVYRVWRKFPEVFLGFAVLPNHFKTVYFVCFSALPYEEGGKNTSDSDDSSFIIINLEKISEFGFVFFPKQRRSGIKARKQSALCVHPDESLTAGMLFVVGVVVILTAALCCEIPLFTLGQHFLG